MENYPPSPSPSPSRFATFEILRIVVPGAYFMFVIFSLCTGFGITIHPITSWEFGALLFTVGSIVAGLSFYSKETPKKRKAFQTNQPSIFILDRSRQISTANPLTDEDARRLYFYILNHLMPITFHDKIFFFGMIYHIMINIRRTSFWFGIIGIICLVVQIALYQQTTSPAVFVVVLIWFVYGMNVRYNKADRKMQENFRDQIFWLEMNKDIVDTLIIRRTQKQ